MKTHTAEPKLLAPPSVAVAEEVEPDDVKAETILNPSATVDNEFDSDDEELNPEEKRAFEKLFKQMKRKTGKKHTDKPAE